MSQTNVHEAKTPIIPYVGIDRISDLLKTMYRDKHKEQSLGDLAKSLKCGPSNLSNVIPTLTLLGLANIKNGALILTPDGFTCADAFYRNDHTKAKIIFKNNVDKSQSLSFVRSLLETNPSISDADIGMALSERFNKKWKHIRTMSIFGSSCASLLAFSGYGHHNSGFLSTKEPTSQMDSYAHISYVEYSVILDLLNALCDFKKNTLSDVMKKLHLGKNKTSSSIKICIMLKLVKKNTNNTYILTKMGNQLTDPTNSDHECSNIFRTSLLNSPYGQIIFKLGKSKHDLNSKNIGEILSHFAKKGWSKQTKISAGKKILTWLIAAKLVEETETHAYKIKHEDLEKDELNVQNNESEQEIDINLIYEIGRSVGALESISSDMDRMKIFSEKITILKDFFQKYDDIKIILDMMKNNFQTDDGEKDYISYQKNMDFVRNKIKEKLCSGVIM